MGPAQRLESPIWHIHGGHPPSQRYPVSFALLFNLVSASNAHNREVLWGFIRSYAPEASPENNPRPRQARRSHDQILRGFIKPQKHYRAPTDKERAALAELAVQLRKFGTERDSEKVQFEIYEIGKSHQFEPLRDWFRAMYEVLFGQTAGPRFGSFAVLYGCEETASLDRTGAQGRIRVRRMMRWAFLFFMVASSAPALGDASEAFRLYADGKYEEAIKAGLAQNDAPGFWPQRARRWQRRPRARRRASIVWSRPSLSRVGRSPPTPNCRMARSISLFRSAWKAA